MGDRRNDSEKIPAALKKPAAFRVAPITDFGSFENYLEDTESLYTECEEAFAASDVKSGDFPKICEKWAVTARTMIMAASALFGKYPADQKNKTRALELFARCTKDSGIRAKNLKLHYELAKQDEAVTPDALHKKFLQTAEGYNFFYRAENTRISYLRRFVNDPEYVSPEYQIEFQEGPVAKRYRNMVPDGHMFLPARPFPPVRIPDWQKGVPNPPEPFCKWKNLPPEDFVYDPEHDEFILPEGYLSADGTIDDKSVVFNWNDFTVTCKFVGSEPVTWPFWKPKDVSDAPKMGTWMWDYYSVLYQQVIGNPNTT